MQRYIVVSTKLLINLEATINLMLAEGWKPCGGLVETKIKPDKEYPMKIDSNGKQLVICGPMQESSSIFRQSMIFSGE